MPSGIWFWVLVFSIPIVAIIFSSLERINRNRVLMRLAESGKPIPPELLRGLGDRQDKSSTLRGGIVVLFVGIGVIVMFWVMVGANGMIPGLTPLMPEKMNWLPAVGAVPLMVGLGLIVASIFQKDYRKE